MLCKRIISILTFNEGNLYRTKLFHPDYIYTSNFLDFWWVDEVIALDISRGKKDRNLFEQRLRMISQKCFVPLSAGGGVSNMMDVDRLFQMGIDKVVLNSAAVKAPTLITEIALKYGSQAVVVSIDAKYSKLKGDYTVYINNGLEDTGLVATQWAEIAVQYGAGEIMITSIDRDGSLTGYDLELSRRIVQSVNVPVIVSGGAGNWQHFESGLSDTGAEGVCTTNIFHLTETSMKAAKEYLKKKNIPVRI